MYTSLAISMLVHGALLGWALISFNSTPPLKIPEVRPVEVAIISPDDLTRLRQGDRNSKKLETQKAKTQKKSKKIKENARKLPSRSVQPKSEPPPPAAKGERKTDQIAAKIDALAEHASRVPKPTKLLKEEKARRKREAERKRANEQRKKAAAKRKAKKLAEKKRKERARKRAEKKRRKRERERKRREKQFDPVKLAALLNKIPDLPKPPSGAVEARKETNLPKGPRAGAEEGRDTQLTASQRSLLAVMMKRAVSECWRVQTGMAGADRLVVEVEIKLHESGKLQGEPRVVNRRGGSDFRDAATNAVRALKQCGPYDLPQELYKGGWDHMVVTFDPQRMF